MLGTVVEIDTSVVLSVGTCSNCGNETMHTYETVTMADKGVERGSIGICHHCLEG